MSGDPETFGPYKIVRGQWAKRDVLFAVDNPDDVIQRHHAKGVFYERPELGMIRRAFPKNGRFIDIGSNVGNHALFAALILRARDVVVVEPNKRAYDILRLNLLINGVAVQVDTRWLGYGISDVAAEGFAVRAPKKNLGGARMVAGEGRIPVVPGDVVVGADRADLIKVDTEGMEMAVLAGLSSTIARDRPTFFIESDDEDREAFLAWVEENNYVILDQYKR